MEMEMKQWKNGYPSRAIGQLYNIEMRMCPGMEVQLGH